MKNKIIIVSIALLSSTAIAENNLVLDENLLNTVVIDSSIISELVLATNKTNSIELWEYLDINKDGSISKMEAAISGEVFDNWDNLDTNKDNKIDTEEFAHLFYK